MATAAYEHHNDNENWVLAFFFILFVCILFHIAIFTVIILLVAFFICYEIFRTIRS